MQRDLGFVVTLQGDEMRPATIVPWNRTASPTPMLAIEGGGQGLRRDVEASSARPAGNGCRLRHIDPDGERSASTPEAEAETATQQSAPTVTRPRLSGPPQGHSCDHLCTLNMHERTFLRRGIAATGEDGESVQQR